MVLEVDEIVYSYLDEHKLKNIVNSWIEKITNLVIERVINEAISAFFRQEYALTIGVICPLFERFILELADKETKGGRSAVIKGALSNILEQPEEQENLSLKRRSLVESFFKALRA